MKKNTFIITLVFIVFNFNAYAQQTQRRYLSGTDKNHTVTWDFYCTGGRNSGQWSTIEVPSQWELQGFGTYAYGSDKKRPDEKGIYKHSFEVPKTWKNKSVNIVFEGVMTDAEVMVNGQKAGPTHQGAFYQFKYDISDLLNYGSENKLKVTVSKQSANKSVNLAERHADYWIFGGIFRPVYLQAKPKEHIKRAAIDAKANGRFSARVFIGGQGKSASSVTGQIMTLDGRKIGDAFNNSLNTKAGYQVISTKLNNIRLWSPEFPHLYKVRFELKDAAGNIIHQTTERFGFRTIELRKGDGFYINGEKVRFKGSSFHAFWPSSGRTLSKDLLIKDVNLMKNMNMNAVRATSYPHSKEFYEVCDSLGLFVMDELAGWQDPYDTEIGHKLVKEMVTTNVNHPSIVIWSSGDEGGNNIKLEDDFKHYDPQNRPIIYPGSIQNGVNSDHYNAYNYGMSTDFRGRSLYLPTEFLHALYDGGGGAGLQDYWRLMRANPTAGGGFIWAFADECVERTDRGGRLDCDGNHAPDGVVGPYGGKEGSYFAIRDIWSPVKVPQYRISPKWNQKLPVENRFFYTNLKQVQFRWKLVDYPGPLDKNLQARNVAKGEVKSPDVAPQSSGFLQLDLPTDWTKADGLQLSATDPHGREIYRWSWPIDLLKNTAANRDRTKNSTGSVQEQNGEFVLSGKKLDVRISKKSGYITKITKDEKKYSLNGGPALTGKKSSPDKISQNGDTVKVQFSGSHYRVSYTLDGDGLVITYRYRPHGNYAYLGVSFNYPEQNVRGITWLGGGPRRVWKNRLAGAELGLWSRQRKPEKDSTEVSLNGYHWQVPKFNGYYRHLNWARLKTSEGPITMKSSDNHIFLGLFYPHIPPHPRDTEAAYPKGDLSFLQGISPVGTKFKSPDKLGPMGQPNMTPSTFTPGIGGRHYWYSNTLTFYFGE